MSDSITITNRSIIQSHRALQQLDAVDEKSKPLYKFQGGAKFRLALAKRLRRITDMAKDINDTQIKTAKDLEYGGDGKDERAKTIQFNTSINEMLDAFETFDMAKLPMSHLDLEANAIPMWVLAELDWLFTEEDGG